ncbi:MAG: DUF4406 domain-containing protein [Clostridia bacterium]|nr:DUF4406 domain-containing protein [Clostridia bacterium]
MLERRVKSLKKIYVCSRLAGDVNNNIEKAKGYARFVAKDCGAIPIAPHIYFTQFLDDTVPEERSFGMMAGLLLLSQCDELWYFGDSVSSGMVREIVAAKEQNIPVRYISASEIERIKNENGGTQNEMEQEIH